VIGGLRAHVRRLCGEDGTTLIETTIACGILFVTLAGLMSMGTLATMHTENQGHLAPRTTEYAQDKMEQLFALRYSDVASDTTVIPTSVAGGSGLAIAGSSNPATPVALYVDYLDSVGNLLCPCVGVTAPAGWFYKRVWQVSDAGVNLKQLTVTAIVARSVANSIVPRATVSALRGRVGNE